MSTLQRSRTIVSAVAATLMIALSAPSAVHAQDQLLPLEEQALAPAAIPGPSVSVEDSRVRAAQQALLSPDLGSVQEEALLAVVATAMTWDATSGYGSVEASRATASTLYAPAAGPKWDETSGYGVVEAIRAEPDLYSVQATGTTQVPSDVRWAPARVITPGASVEEMRVLAAQRGLQSRDLGSMQEEALFAIVATGASWDDTSGYGALEASRATIGHPVAGATVGTSPDSLPAALATGRRSESAHLATVLLPGEDAMMANSDDRIANALFGDQSSHDGAVAPGRLTIEHSAVRTTAEATRVAVAQQALHSGDLGSLQEEALIAVMAASRTEDDASVDDALASTRAMLLTQFRAVELSSSRSLGAAQQESVSCDIDS